MRERIASYTYDVNGRLTKACYDEDGETNENSYTYDAVGNRISSIIDGVETSYVYNGLDQLKEERKSAGGFLTSKTTHTYDSSGNRIKEREETYSYSDQGQLLAGSEGTSVEENTMTYTPQNMMSSLKRTRDGKTVLTQKNRYDGDGQRIRKEETTLTVNPITEEESEETEVKSYFYQGDSVLYTRNEGRSISSMNLLTAAGNIISTARNVNRDSEKWYLFNKDDQGSTKSIIDDGGNRAIAYEYDEYGNITLQHGEGIDNEVGYTGQIFDESTGLYYYNARFYDPETGSFTTQDTYRGDGAEPTTLNYYTYCAGDPVNYTDPTGHSFLRKAKKKAKRFKRKLKRKVKRFRKRIRKAKARVRRTVKRIKKNARRTARAKYGQAKAYVRKKRKHAKKACKKIKAKAKLKVKKPACFTKKVMRTTLHRAYTLTPAAKAVYYPVSFCHFELRSCLNGKHPTYDEVASPNSGWVKLKPDESKYHDNHDEYPDEKYIKQDGREAVFMGTRNGPVVMKDPEYIATYNYIPLYVPDDGKHNTVKDVTLLAGTGAGHFMFDMLPYYLTGFSNTRLQFEK